MTSSFMTQTKRPMIKVHASISEPLRRLTKKDTSFHFGLSRNKHFQVLKEKLSEAGTLVYFDKDAPTKVSHHHILRSASIPSVLSTILQTIAINI